MSNIEKAFVIDGQIFATKAEAEAYIRKPKVLAALKVVTGGDATAAAWLQENQDDIESAFDTGTIRRVSKADARKLAQALKEVLESSLTAQFIRDNHEEIASSFRWPSVKRMTEEEKAVAARNSLIAIDGSGEELAAWIIANQNQILEAFKAGIVKREVSAKAQEALAKYRAEKAAEKAAAEAAAAEAEA